jgi:hypothetical protein
VVLVVGVVGRGRRVAGDDGHARLVLLAVAVVVAVAVGAAVVLVLVLVVEGRAIVVALFVFVVFFWAWVGEERGVLFSGVLLAASKGRGA